jgi:YfiH family protein
MEAFFFMPSPSSSFWFWRLEGPGVVGGFTWRGQDDANDFNLSGDSIEAPAPFTSLRDRLGASSMIVGEQVHGRRVFTLTSGARNGWLVVPECDGLVTPTPGLALAVRGADCVPILLWVKGAAIGAVHAGWRGMAGGIVAAAVTRLMRLGHTASDIYAAIGPAIGPCCFEIGPDAAARLSALPAGEEAVVRREGKSWYADLAMLATAQLAATGVRAGHILTPGECTSCRDDLFFSYRREGALAGRQVGAIVLTARG